jgi:large subunit ribosomal protein L22
MQAQATSRYQRASAKKLNLIVDLIRGKDVPSALNILRFLHKPTKAPVFKTLQSAVANAISKAGKVKLDEKDLVVSEARVTPGPSMKRWQAGARGSGAPYKHRTAHVYVSVKTKEESGK